MPGRTKNAPAARSRALEPTQAGVPLLVKLRDAMVKLVEDEGTPASARASAARTALECERELQERGGDRGARGRPIEVMDEAELDAEIAAELQRRRPKAREEPEPQ